MLLWAIKTQAPSASCKLLLQHMGFLAREPHHKVYASIATLAGATQLNPKTVETCLKRLEAAALIRRLAERSGLGGAAVYELLGFDTTIETSPEIGVGSTDENAFEVPPNLDGSSPNFSGKFPQISNEVPPKTGDKQKKRITRNKQRGERSAPRQRLQEDWRPSQKTVDHAKRERPDLDLDVVLRNFRDYWIAQGTARASWDATFRTWVMRERTASVRPTSRDHGLDTTDYRRGLDPATGKLL